MDPNKKPGTTTYKGFRSTTVHSIMSISLETVLYSYTYRLHIFKIYMFYTEVSHDACVLSHLST